MLYGGGGAHGLDVDLAFEEDVGGEGTRFAEHAEHEVRRVDVAVAETCVAGLVSRGLSENEIWLVAREPEGVCPNLGIAEPRIREIIAKDWDAAGCTQFTKEQMLHALDSGACGGDAG